MIDDYETDAFIDELDSHYSPFKTVGFWAFVLCAAGVATYFAVG